jgi:hypothetical protein
VPRNAGRSWRGRTPLRPVPSPCAVVGRGLVPRRPLSLPCGATHLQMRRPFAWPGAVGGAGARTTASPLPAAAQPPSPLPGRGEVAPRPSSAASGRGERHHSSDGRRAEPRPFLERPDPVPACAVASLPSAVVPRRPLSLPFIRISAVALPVRRAVLPVGRSCPRPPRRTGATARATERRTFLERPDPVPACAVPVRSDAKIFLRGEEVFTPP